MEAQALPTDISRQAKEAFEEGHDADVHVDVHNKYDVVVHQWPAGDAHEAEPSSARDHIPPEYRVSYVRDGTLPQRVLHLRNRAWSIDTKSLNDEDEEKGKLPADTPDFVGGHELTGLEKEMEVTAKPDSNIVDFDGPDDPENPQNWTPRKRWIAVALISAITFITPLASSMVAPGVPQLMADFHSTNEQLASFVVSVYLLGYVFGPLLVSPLSELYGREIVFLVSNVFFVIFTIISAVSTDLGMFIFFRFCTGFCGATPLTVGGGVMADLFPQEKRGAAMSLWAMGPLIPIIGPVAGGYIAEDIGWRWILWILAIVSGVVTLLTFFFYHETYAPTILARKTKRLIKETSNPNLRSKYDNGTSTGELFKKAIIRPSKMLVKSPMVFFLSLDMAVSYGYLYLLFTTVTYVYEDQYHFSTGAAGLTYLGIGVGSFLGLVATGITSDKYIKKKSANGEMKPEYRLPPLVPAAILMPIGLFWYGWSADKKLHWIMPILGTAFFAIGLISTFMPISTYLVDAYPLYAASATAAATVLRSLFGALLPLAGQSMYNKLGLGWGNSLLAFIALGLVPVPFVFIRYGERIRKSPRFQMDL